MRWIKLFGHACKEDAQQEKIEEEIEIDEMHHFIGKKTVSLDLESTWSYLQTIAWECGDCSAATLEKLDGRVNLHKAKQVYTGNYQTYAEVTGARALKQGKENTYKIEQNNGRQRHWLASFHRRSLVVSKSVEIMDL